MANHPDFFDMETQALTRADVLHWTTQHPGLRIVPAEDFADHIGYHWRPLVKFVFSDSQIKDDVFYIMEQHIEFPSESERFQIVDARAVAAFEARGYHAMRQYTRGTRQYVVMALED